MRIRQLIIRLFFATALLWVAYLFIVNVLLMSGLLEAMMSRNKVRSSISWERAWSIVPGHAEIRGFELKGQTVRNQYWLRIREGAIEVRLLSLARFHFHASSLDASGITYWQRRQRVKGEPLPKGASFEPTIPGMPDERPPLEDLQPRERRFPWLIQLDNISGDEVEEAWLTAYRSRGSGHLSGDLIFELGGDVAVPDFRLIFPTLEVHTGTTAVATDLTLELDGELVSGPARGQRLPDFLERSNGHISVAGQVADFGFLNLMLKRLPRFHLSGAGELTADVNLARGMPELGSSVTFESQEISAVLKALEISGRGSVVMSINSDQRVELQADIRDIGASSPGLEPYAESVPHLEITASSSLVDAEHAFEDPRLSLLLPPCRIDNLATLNHVLPAKLPVRFLPTSSATLEGFLDLDEYSGSGAIRLLGDHIEADINHTTLVGNVKLDLVLDDADPDGLVFDMAGSALSLSSGSSNSPIDEDPWRAEIRFPEAVLGLSAPLAMEGQVVLYMTDMTPLITAFASQQPSLLVDLLSINDISASAQLALSQESMTITEVEIQGSGLGRSLLGGHGATVVLSSEAIDPKGGFRALHLNLDLEQVTVPDLSVLNRLLPETTGLSFDPHHSGTVSAHLEVEDEVISGAAVLEAMGVGIEACNLPFNADLVVELVLPKAEISEHRLELSGSRLWLGQVLTGDGDGTALKPWNATVNIINGQLLVGDDMRIEATIEAWLDSTRPLIAAYLGSDQAGLRLEDLLNVVDVAVSAEMEVSKQTLRLDHLSISGRGTGGGHLRGPGFEVTGSNLAIDPEKGFTSLDLEINLPPSEIVDLAAFNNYIPPTSGLRFAPESHGSVSAELRLVNGVATGRARFEALGIDLDLGRLSVVGDLTAHIELKHGDLSSQQYDLSGSTFRIDSASLSDDDESAWWARVDLPRAAFELKRPFALDARIYLEMGDSRPLVDLVAGPDQAWLSELLTFTEVTGSTSVRLDQEVLRVSGLEIRGFGRSTGGVFGSNLKITATGEDVDLTKAVEGLSVTVDLPSSSIQDLSLFNRYLPPSSGVTLLPGGEGQVSVHLKLSSGQAEGHFRLSGKQVGAEVMGTSIRGDIELDVPISAGNLSASELDISASSLHLSDFTLTDSRGRKTAGWWASLSLPQGTVRMDLPLGLEGQAELRLKDSWPVATYAEERSRFARFLRRLLIVDDISGRSSVSLVKGGLIFDDLLLEGDRFRAEGRLGLSEEGHHGLLLLDFHGLHGAVHIDGDKKRFKLIRPERWYRRLLHAERASSPEDGNQRKGAKTQ